MKTSQANRILSLLRNRPNRTVTCSELSYCGLYHHASQRIGELKRKGFDIRFTKSDEWHEGRYTLISEPVQYAEEPNGQLVAFQESNG